jgi:peptidoglycan/xylan/chitin deacetylase (PgdA/CDA1 family)
MELRGSYLRLLVRCIWVYLLHWSGYLRLAEQGLRAVGAVVTLTFHRVLDDASLHHSNSVAGIVIRKETFGELVDYITSHYETVSLKNITPGAPSEKNRIAITFDDGWHDNHANAFPILRALQVPAIIFICPGLMGQRTPFWPEEAMALLRAIFTDSNPNQLAAIIENLKQHSPEIRDQYLAGLRSQLHDQRAKDSPTAARTLSWDEVHEMDKAGVSFGSHTETHQILTGISESEARAEVLHSKLAIETNLAKACWAFAYPNGNWSSSTRRIVKDAGFNRAVTTEHGAWISSSDPLAIPRMNVYEDNVVGMNGRFWPAMFRYTTFYTAWRVMKSGLKAGRRRAETHVDLRSTELASPRTFRPTTISK